MTFIATKRKAIAALVAPLIVAAVARYGFDIDNAAVTAGLIALLSALAVHTTKNKETPQ